MSFFLQVFVLSQELVLAYRLSCRIATIRLGFRRADSRSDFAPLYGCMQGEENVVRIFAIGKPKP
jgi:hypothetical protein